MRGAPAMAPEPPARGTPRRGRGVPRAWAARPRWPASPPRFGTPRRSRGVPRECAARPRHGPKWPGSLEKPSRPLRDQLAQWEELSVKEVVRAVDHAHLGLRQLLRQRVERHPWTVLVHSRANDEQRRLEGDEAGERRLAGRSEGRRYEREARKVTLTRRDLGRDDGAEGEAGKHERHAGDRTRQVTERRLGVLLLTPASVVSSGRPPHAAEIEPQGGKIEGGTHLLEPHDDWVVHVAAVQRMGVADDDSRPRSGGDGETGL